MKRILSILSLVIIASLVIMACNRKPATAEAAKIQYSDTVGLAEFQAWKAENERLSMMEKYNQQNNVVTTAPARTRTRTVYRTAGTRGTTTTSTAKRGWSKAAKGAVIGGAGGAVLGAVINKRNRVAGGVIGGVIGAGVGYGIGRSMDKRDGRY
ncbi:MAG TPA: glycine zipper domain-containing protein [Chitinophagaceae bacterium]|nr:glycine zipper domain-containing protein [Chitinophagaceae bacterium]